VEIEPQTEQEKIYAAIKRVQTSERISITQAADRVLGRRGSAPSETAIPTQCRIPAGTLRG